MTTRADIEDMIARCALGDRAALSALYDATSAKLLGVALRILQDRSAAEDALQDVYVKIWHNADRYRSGTWSPMTWLITIARNTAIDRKRTTREMSGLEGHIETLASDKPDPEDEAIAASEARRVIACMETLPEDRARAIRQVYLEGVSYADCAEGFGIPLNTVRTWLRRGLISLRECLGAVAS